jgi:hypothetical protein
MHCKTGLTLSQTRKLAKVAQGQVAAGRDPLGERQKIEGTSTDTLKYIVEEYFRKEGDEMRSSDFRHAALKNHILPKLGKRQIDEIDRLEITRLIETIKDSAGLWEAAERDRYPLRQADAYNVLADIKLAEGNKSAAIAAAIEAHRTAWCDELPYAYHWGLERAKAHLAALGACKPDMPPFDESKFEPMPEVDINSKDQYWIDPNSLD